MALLNTALHDSESLSHSCVYANDLSDVENHVSLRVCSEAHQGMRKYMEDELSVVLETESEDQRAFLAVFDGHGGRDAPCFARDNLYRNIKQELASKSEDPDDVKKAIKNGFCKTHNEMKDAIDLWPKRKDGHKSTSGTTATVAIMRGQKLYVAHVGDSAAVLAQKGESGYAAVDLTVDHKPESPLERARIEAAGGRIAYSSGVARVVWRREVLKDAPVDQVGEENRARKFEYVPFLAVSRALGDLWSYNEDRDIFVVSPEPDIVVVDLDRDRHKFLIVASDGLWGVMKGQEAVSIVQAYESESSKIPSKRNSAQELVNRALEMWRSRRTRADNVTAIVVFFDDEFAEVHSAGSDTLDQEAETDVVDDDEDTPTDDTLKRSDSRLFVVRQLGFRCFTPVDGARTVAEADAGGVMVPLQTAPSVDGGAHVVGGDVEGPVRENRPGKRKSEELQDHAPVDLRKRPCPEDGFLGSDSSKFVTDLSPESLKDLRFDDDLGFADDESDGSSSDEDENGSIESSANFFVMNALA